MGDNNSNTEDSSFEIEPIEGISTGEEAGAGEGNPGEGNQTEEGEGNNPPVEDPSGEEGGGEEEGGEDSGEAGEAGSEEGGEETPLVLSFVEKSGIKLEESELAGLDDTVEGWEKASQIIAQKQAEETFNQTFEQNPKLKAHLEFVQNGGDESTFMETFYPKEDWTKVEFKEDDADLQEKILRGYYEKKGIDDSLIEVNVQAAKSQEKLGELSEKALEELAAVQNAEQQQLLSNQAAAAESERQAAAEAWRQVQKTIKEAESIQGLPIQNDKRDEFLDYLGKPVDQNGNTARDQRWAQLTNDEILAVDYLLFMGLDNLNKIIDIKAGTQAARDKRINFKGQQQKHQRGGGGQQSQGQGAGETKFSEDVEIEF